MSVITLTEAKSFLDVIHNSDDDKIQLLLEGAEDEVKQYLNRNNLDEWEANVSNDGLIPASVLIGILLLLQSNYQSAPEDIEKLRKNAEIKLTPYRLQIGI